MAAECAGTRGGGNRRRAMVHRGAPRGYIAGDGALLQLSGDWAMLLIPLAASLMRCRARRGPARAAVDADAAMVMTVVVLITVLL